MRAVPGGFDRYNSVAATAKIEIQTEGRGRSGACECRLLPPLLMLWNYILKGENSMGILLRSGQVQCAWWERGDLLLCRKEMI